MARYNNRSGFLFQAKKPYTQPAIDHFKDYDPDQHSGILDAGSTYANVPAESPRPAAALEPTYYFSMLTASAEEALLLVDCYTKLGWRVSLESLDWALGDEQR